MRLKEIRTKPFLAQHIPKSASDQFVTALSLVVELILPITEPIPEVSRDKKMIISLPMAQ